MWNIDGWYEKESLHNKYFYLQLSKASLSNVRRLGDLRNPPGFSRWKIFGYRLLPPMCTATNTNFCFVKLNQARKLLFSKCDVTYRRSNYEALGIAILNSYDNSRKHPTVFHGNWITKVAFHGNWITKAVWRFSGSFLSLLLSMVFIMWQLQRLVLFKC